MPGLQERITDWMANNWDFKRNQFSTPSPFGGRLRDSYVIGPPMRMVENAMNRDIPNAGIEAFNTITTPFGGAQAAGLRAAYQGVKPWLISGGASVGSEVNRYGAEQAYPTIAEATQGAFSPKTAVAKLR